MAPEDPTLPPSPLAPSGAGAAAAPASGARGSSGDRLGEVQARIGARYRLLDAAGHGGMGQVFQAQDTLLGRRVAIKVLHESAGAPDRGRLVAEARAMAGLKHPNIVGVLEASVDGPMPFLVMEWVEGLHLDAAWRGMDRAARLGLFLQVVDAVAAAHAAGIIHRDLKPANVIVDRAARPILVDFGLARPQPAPGTPHTLAGTPGYAAPEQFEEGPGVGPATDIYALGVMLFELLTDRRPFEGGSASEVVERARTQDPPLPEALAPGVPAGLQRICLVALERSPARRYPTARAMADDLRRSLRGETVVARPSMLMDRFLDQVEEQIARAGVWERQGLITRAERDRLVRVLHAIQAPESPWIVDSRRLSASQVTLYVGGWLVLLALTVGLAMSWGDLAPAVRQGAAWSAAALIAALGLALHLRQQQRVALGYLFTLGLASPALMWLLFRETGWLGAAQGPERQLLHLEGLGNAQALAAAGVWLGVSVSLRLYTRAAPFTLLAVGAGVAAWLAAWLNLGRWAEPSAASAAEWGAWAAAAGFLALGPALRLDRGEEEVARELGRWKVRRRDAWAVLWAGVALIAGGLAAMAYFQPERWWTASMWAADPLDRHWWTYTANGYATDSGARAVAFILNGLVLLGVTAVLARRRTPLRRRVADALRWVIPSHFLAAALALEYEDYQGLWWLWLALLAGGSAAIAAVSVPTQWKPFLYTGLGYLAIAYARAFDRVEMLPEAGRAGARAGLMLGLMVLGVGAMIAAWRITLRRARPREG